MTRSVILLILPLMVVATIVRGQMKPARLEINNLLSQVPIAQTSSACYAICTTTTDASGFSAIKDNGPVFNHLTDQLNSIMTAGMNAMNPGAAAAMQAQASANRKPPTTNPAIMQGLGKASAATMQIHTLVSELGRKLAAIMPASVPSEPNCPDVQQGGYAGPTCACTYARSVTGEQKMVAAEDAALAQKSALLNQYNGLIGDQIAIIDKLESDAKYGDGIADQTLLQLLGSSQRQGISGLVSFLSMASGTWSDGANRYLYLVNAKANHCK